MSLLEALGLELTQRMRDQGLGEPKPKPTEGRPRSNSDSGAPGLKGATPDVDSARFDTRWSASGPRIEALRADLAAKKLGTVLDGALKKAIESFEAADAELVKAQAAPDFVKAYEELVKADAAIKAYDAAFPAENDKSKAQYLKLKAEQQAVFAKLDKAVAGNAFGSPPLKFFNDPMTRYPVARKLMDDGEQAGNFLTAHSGAKQSLSATMLLKGAFNSANAEWQLDLGPAAKLVTLIEGGGMPGVDGKALAAAHKSAAAAVARANSDNEVAAAYAAMAGLPQAMKDYRELAARSIVAGSDAKGGAKAARTKAMAYLKQDPDALKLVQAEPGGKAALDAMVGDLGGAAKDADSKAFVRAAIEARFGPKLGDTDLTTKYLPRLYKALGMVPESHTKTNPKLTEINRSRVKLMPSGDYSYDEDTKKGVINLVTPKTGTVDWLQSKAMAIGVKKIVGHLGGKDVSTFDALTLHEVGHSVDEDKGFMAGKMGNVAFGGWQDHPIEEVVAAVGSAKGFFNDFGTLPRAFLDAYLKAVLEKKKKPAEESSVTAALGPADKPDWKAIAKHPAVECAENIRLKNSDSGLWDRGDSAAAKYALGSSVYQESYDGTWTSYALSARGAILCNYQFRAAGEWFAEPYAAFFLKKLKPSHPLYAMLEKDQEAGKAAQRAAK